MPGLWEADVGDDPIGAFASWFDHAAAAGVPEPGAMVLATADAEGTPSARTVLLKAVDRRGFVFYTNRASRKGADLAANPRAALVFNWVPVRRQVLVRGDVEPVDDDESDAYFASRPRGSQIGAWASRQSEVAADRAELDRRAADVEARFDGLDVPRPPFWGGYRVIPVAVEFWQGRIDRLHDRLRFRRDGVDAPWVLERLFP
jgi:pyridoxamine 5'-phosphate oxidase